MAVNHVLCNSHVYAAMRAATQVKDDLRLLSCTLPLEAAQEWASKSLPPSAAYQAGRAVPKLSPGAQVRPQHVHKVSALVIHSPAARGF